MGNKACGALSGRNKRAAEAVSVPSYSASASAAAGQHGEPKRPGRRSESLEWLNELVRVLWPKMDAAVQKIIHEQVTPQLQHSLPGPFQGTYFKKFTLGKRTPELGPIEVVEREDGVKLILNINYESDVDIEIHAVMASVGVKAITLRGQLMLRLGPLINEMPIVGGITAYFVDAPELDLDFTGLGNVAEMPVVYGIIQKQIHQAIKNAMVLPNCIAVPLGTPEQGVEPALLKKPKPLAMLRATAVKATNLEAMDWNLTRKSSSDPFVKITVANDTWKSSVVKQNCNPTWTPEDVHDFVVFDRDQHVWLEVYDQDMVSSSDLIGKAEPLKVVDAVGKSGQSMPLLRDGSNQDHGALQMKFQWLELTQDVEPNTAGCVVRVEVQQLMVNGTAAVSANLCNQEKCTCTLSPTDSVPSAEDKYRAEVARRCRASGLDEETILKISGLSKSELAAFDANVHGPIEFQAAFYLSVPRKSLETEELTLTALNAKQKPFARTSLKMSELLEKKSLCIDQLQRQAGFRSESTTCCSAESTGLEGGELDGDVSAMIRVSIFGLR